MRKCFFAVGLVLIGFFAVAQPTPPGDPPPGPGAPVPLAGIEILLVAGSILGVGKLLRNNFRQSK